MSEYIVRVTGFPGVMKREMVSKLVRCKDCKHGRPYKHTKDYVSCEVDCDPIDRDSDFFCKSGERRE